MQITPWIKSYEQILKIFFFVRRRKIDRRVEMIINWEKGFMNSWIPWKVQCQPCNSLTCSCTSQFSATISQIGIFKTYRNRWKAMAQILWIWKELEAVIPYFSATILYVILLELSRNNPSISHPTIPKWIQAEPRI